MEIVDEGARAQIKMLASIIAATLPEQQVLESIAGIAASVARDSGAGNSAALTELAQFMAESFAGRGRPPSP